MRRHEFRQRIRSSPALLHVRVVKGMHRPHLAQERRPVLHPAVRDPRAGSRREEEGGAIRAGGKVGRIGHGGIGPSRAERTRSLKDKPLGRSRFRTRPLPKRPLSLVLIMTSQEQSFLREFEARTLPFQEWRHRAHLTLAYLYVTSYPLETALQKASSGIRAYNAAHGVIDTPTSGYHETMTQFWVRIVRAMVDQYGPAGTAEEFLDGQPQLGQKKIHRLFYSPALFMSPEAKATFVPPDLAPLPRTA